MTPLLFRLVYAAARTRLLRLANHDGAIPLLQALLPAVTAREDGPAPKR